MLAGQAALIVCGVTFVIAALVAWATTGSGSRPCLRATGGCSVSPWPCSR